MFIRLDPASSVSLFDQLADELRAAILTGTARAGERLPAARDLAGSLGVNRNTVLKVYQALRDEGLVELRRGRGAVVLAERAQALDLTGAAGTLDSAGSPRTTARSVLVADVRALVTRAAQAGVGPDALCSLVRKEYP